MAQYLLSVFQPVGPAPAQEVLAPIMADLEALNREMKAAGAWVFAAGLHPTDTATVVRQQGTETLMTDGPFAEAKEHLGGFTVIEAPDFGRGARLGRKTGPGHHPSHRSAA